MKVTWQATVVTVALLAFVFGVVWLALDRGASFSTVWAALGSLLGILTGAVPSYFFASGAKADAAKQTGRAQVYAEHLPPAQIADVQAALVARNLV